MLSYWCVYPEGPLGSVVVKWFALEAMRKECQEESNIKNRVKSTEACQIIKSLMSVAVSNSKVTVKNKQLTVQKKKGSLRNCYFFRK